MFFYLVVWEFKYLKLIWEGCLCGLSFCKIVDYFLVWECLLDICIAKIDDRVSVWPRFSLDSIVEDHFFLSTCVDSLYFSIVTYNLIYDLWICVSLSMIFSRILEPKVLFLLFLRSFYILSHTTHILRIHYLVLLALFLAKTMRVIFLKKLILALTLLVILQLLLFLVHLINSLSINLFTIHVIFFNILDLLLIIIFLFHILLWVRVATFILLLEAVSALSLPCVARYLALHLGVACCSWLWSL